MRCLSSPEAAEAAVAEAIAHAVAHAIAHAIAAPAAPSVVRPAHAIAVAPQPALLHGRVVDEYFADQIDRLAADGHRVEVGDGVEEADELGEARLVDEAYAGVHEVGREVQHEVVAEHVRGVVERARVQRVHALDGRRADAEQVVVGRGEVGHRRALDASRAERACERASARHEHALGRVRDAGHLHRHA